MDKTLKLCLSGAIISYAVRLVTDLIMYVFMIYNRSDVYNDLYYLIIPQFVATALIIVFYALFFRDEFFSWFFRISTVVLILSNIAFSVLLYFDSKVDYLWYFALVAGINFMNALYLKCNIIPIRKNGEIEYLPMLFEIVEFICMVISLYSLFCGFPILDTGIWTYYDVNLSFKINMVCELIMCFAYILCMKNNAEFIRDNMFGEEIIE